MMVQAPGATIYYETVGTGPLLLVLQGGAGDSGGSAGLVQQLSDRYTILSYDRRGLSRSKVADEEADTSVAQHADDVSRVLKAVTSEPVYAVGISIGAIIGLELMRAHPEQLRGLVAHEPPATGVLPPELAATVTKMQKDVEDALKTKGLGAMKMFLDMTGFDLKDREPGFQLPQPNPAYAENMGYFLKHDAKAVRDYALDVDALKGRPIVVAAGTSSRHLFTHQCAEALARALGVPVVEFPGGHNGYAFHPRGFSAKLDEVLRSL
jgi:pimeloyl-ACP methyl ester carboxylesterase